MSWALHIPGAMIPPWPGCELIVKATDGKHTGHASAVEGWATCEAHNDVADQQQQEDGYEHQPRVFPPHLAI